MKKKSFRESNLQVKNFFLIFSKQLGPSLGPSLVLNVGQRPEADLEVRQSTV